MSAYSTHFKIKLVFGYKEIDDFGKNVLKILSEESSKIYNKTTEYLYEYYLYKNKCFEQKTEYLKLSKYMNVYQRLTDKFYISNSGNLVLSLKIALEKWKHMEEKIRNGTASIPSYTFNKMPIDINKECFDVYKNENNYFCKVGLLSRKYCKEKGFKSGQFTLQIEEGEKYSKDILDRIISGEYKLSSSKILKKKKDWYVSLCYTMEKQKQPDLDLNNIMGIDMGIVHPAYIAFNNSWQRSFFGRGEIDNYRKRIEALKEELQRSGKYCGQGRIGHGTKTRVKPIYEVRDKIARFRDTINYKYSKYIVDLAIKNGCGTIQMEDLRDVSKRNKFLKNWSYYDLQQKIINKANAIGINVIKIKPSYTSQRCSKCGHIHEDNRQSQSYFKCIKCGYKANADFNAARNIATKDIDIIIENQLTKQICEIYNNGLIDKEKIGDKMEMKGKTVAHYLINGAKNGLCNYGLKN